MKKEITNSESRDEKLVTVAIHTYEKAQILKSILESEGIPAVIHGINLIEPTIAGSVRVRINEKDLPNALRVIEQVDFKSTDEKEDDEEKVKVINEVLVAHTFELKRLRTESIQFTRKRFPEAAILSTVLLFANLRLCLISLSPGSNKSALS